MSLVQVLSKFAFTEIAKMKINIQYILGRFKFPPNPTCAQTLPLSGSPTRTSNLLAE